MSENENPRPWPQQPSDHQPGSFPQWGDEASAPQGQPAQPYGQPETPYGQPAQPYGQPETPYGQPAQPYGQPNHPYGQPDGTFGQPGQSYGQTAGYQNPAYQPAPYGTASYPGLPATQPGPAWGGLGLVSLITAGVATLIGIVLAWVSGTNFADVIATLPPEALDGSGEIDPATLDPALETKLATAGAAALGMLIPSTVGLVAIIMGAVAIAKQKGRPAGIAAVILAIAAPILCGMLFAILMGGSLSNLPR